MKKTMAPPKLTPCPYQDIDSIQFSGLSSSQILNYSVLEIDEPQFYEKGEPVPGGLFDLRLGISEPGQKCLTCAQSIECPGHFGHIKLSQPVLHYGFMNTLVKVLKCVCLRCFRVKRSQDKQIKAKIKQIKKINDPEKRLNLMVKTLQNIKKCNKVGQEQDIFDKNYKPCGYFNPSKIRIKNYKICCVNQQGKQTTIQRIQIQKILQGLTFYSNQCQALGFTVTKPIDLMIENLIVPPPQIRPYVLINYEAKCEDDLSVQYMKIIKINNQLKQRNRHQNIGDRNQLIQLMQKLIGAIMIKLKSFRNQYGLKNHKMIKLKNIKSISERLKGKQGRFRQNLLGKRVDFSARTVISPDPNLDLNEVGIPQKIAKNLTYPQRISSLNIDRITQLCLNQKVKYLINDPETNLENKRIAINVQKIAAQSKQQILPYLGYGMIAQRILQDGDYVLVNRQPTLHRMSMMAHRVKILPNSTFRINLAVCMPYNADFDGDQMNVHVPQSFQTVSQLKNIATVENQIVGPKNGTISMGFSQDSLLGAFLLTSRQTFITKQEIMNLLMCVFNQNENKQQQLIQLSLPSILKPEPLWTGKQLVSMIMPKQIQIKSLKTKSNQTSYQFDDHLIIKSGQILTGCLQKQHIGPSSSYNNIIHIIWMQKSSKQAQKFIYNLQKIVYSWLSGVGFSLGAIDVRPQAQLQKMKAKQIKQINRIYFNSFNQFRDKSKIMSKHLHQQGKKIIDSFEYNINLQLNNHLSKVQQMVKSVQKSSHNNIYKIIEAKSKGSETNLAQIVYSVGNQNINGQRCPLQFNRRCLPHFCKDDSSPLARGYVINSFFQGLTPSQFFFHSMGGRQGLSDTAIKTSHVGYIQRKLIKSLQDLIVKYDSSVRDSNNNIVQKYYGEDGFCSQFVEKHKLRATQMNAKKFRQTYKWKQDELKRLYKYSAKQIHTIKSEYSKLYKSRNIFKKYTIGHDLQSNQYYCPITVQKLINIIKVNSKKENKNQQNVDPYQVCLKIQQLLSQCLLPQQKFINYIKKVKQTKKSINQNQNQGDYDSFSDQFEREDVDKQKTMQRKYNSSQKISETSSQFQIFKIHIRFSLSSKIICKEYRLSKQNFTQLISLIKQRFFKSLSVSGQAVGCLASQSIGQPTTQMTLNTFHLAGISDRNVTLGLPRLQQLLNCSSQAQSQLTIFPSHPILQSQSKSKQNQQYLLDLLFYHLPQRTINSFIYESRYYFHGKQLDINDNTLVDTNNDKFKTAPWHLQLQFNYNKIHSKRIWDQIVDKIERISQNQYKIHETVDFNDIFISMQDNNKMKQKQKYGSRCASNSINKIKNPKIVLKMYNNSIKLDRMRIQKKSFGIIDFIQLVQTRIKNTQICGIKGVNSVKISKRTLALQQQSGNKTYITFQASGNSLRNCLPSFQINGCRTYSNNPRQIAQVLGIQAARRSLINQFKQVLKPYGIVINYRHLSVLTDWMCLRGVLTPVNRNGLNQIKNVSALTKASFQKASDVLFKAAVYSSKDNLKDTSQRIIFGQTTDCGTSQCQIMIDPQKCVNYVSKLPQIDEKKMSMYQCQKLLKTPQYQYQGQSVTNDNSFSITKRQLNNSFHSMNMSPNLNTKSPSILNHYQSFSPSYSPSLSAVKLSSYSPRFYQQDTMKKDGGRTDYSANRYASPLYQRNMVSPSYSRNMIISSSSNRYNTVVRDEDKKEEQYECCDFNFNQETQRTDKTSAIVQQKDQDQF